MTLYSNRFLSALTLGAFIAFGSAYAADEGKKSEPAPHKAEPAPQKSDRAEQKAEAGAPKKEVGKTQQVGRTQKELNTCKQEAQGKEGPERANFMTDCLKAR